MWGPFGIIYLEFEDFEDTLQMFSSNFDILCKYSGVPNKRVVQINVLDGQ